ncbi:hypothetical protein Q4555_07490 [Octadecabacter sp. 1_MG-2023]|uniref:hypothetical protein n=1 Tax=unclassified Octadecabacter TaxID=196158 RepID=UPI001C0974EB|nr:MULTISPECIES: hypothetical protein [unclassified Octadecabacter]MBU2994205.1 hypothetical protein [Octadecabacter sp. B2R22]MDO6734506.1 hypothetical protein [Octadecabacter sp. 1_MG-2023]
MDPDLMLVIGLVVGGFSIPSIMGALADGRVPRAAAIAVMIAGGLIVLAIRDNPGGYQLADIPDIFVSVVGRYIN